MSIADELRRDAEAALKEDGMYYSGEYLDGIAKKVEEVEAENAKLREFVRMMHGLLLEKCEGPHDQYHGKPCESCAEAGTDDCPKVISRQLRELGIEVE